MKLPESITKAFGPLTLYNLTNEYERFCPKGNAEYCLKRPYVKLPKISVTIHSHQQQYL